MRTISKIAFFLFMTGIAILPKEISAQQTQQKETKAQERERKLVESRKQHADQTRGQYLPNKFADVYVGKWETEDKSVQLEITKRITEFNYLEFHSFMDVLDVHFTRFEAAGKNIIGLIGDEFEFRYSGGFGGLRPTIYF